jgi:hypothetical protein
MILVSTPWSALLPAADWSLAIFVAGANAGEGTAYERPPEPLETVSVDDCWDWPRLRHPAAIIAAETMRTAAILFKLSMEESEPLGNKESL